MKYGEPVCDELVVAFWMDLSPGERFEFPVDLTQCPADKLGYYKFYGYRTTKKSADFLDVGDGIAIEALDLQTGAVSTSVGTNNRQPEEIFMHVQSPTEFLLSAENVGNDTLTVRFTWTYVVVSEGPISDGSSEETVSNSKPKRGNGRWNR